MLLYWYFYQKFWRYEMYGKEIGSYFNVYCAKTGKLICQIYACNESSALYKANCDTWIKTKSASIRVEQIK